MIELALPFIPLQKAIYQRLISDNQLSTLLAKDENNLGIYDYITEDTPFPYIVIGEPTLEEEQIKANEAFDVSVTLHVWHNQQESGNYGNYVPYTIINVIHNIFKYNRLEVEGYEVVRLQFREPKVFDDIDNVLKHGVITLKFVLKRSA